MSDKIDCTKAFLQNQSKVFQNQSLSDVTLQVGNASYPAHKVFLAASSPYFQRMFYGGDWKERKEQVVKLEETAECQKVFPDFLRYFYTGDTTANRESTVALLTLADKYDVEVLKDHLSQYMTKSVMGGDIEGAISWLSYAERMDLKQLSQRCYETICLNFEQASSLPNWCSLSHTQIITILQRSDVVVQSEYIVFVGVHNWLQGNEDGTDRLDKILPFIGFKKMTTDELLQVETSDIVSQRGGAGDQIRLYVLEAFRLIAISKAGNDERDDKISERIYNPDDAFQSGQFANGSVTLIPQTQHENPGLLNILQSYKYKLNRAPTGEVTITVPSVTRYISTQNPHYGHGREYMYRRAMDVGQEQYIQSSYYLYNEVPGDVLVKLLVLFRNNKGTITRLLNHSSQTKMPRQNGGALLEIPCPSSAAATETETALSEITDSDGFEVLYSFQILQVK